MQEGQRVRLTMDMDGCRDKGKHIRLAGLTGTVKHCYQDVWGVEFDDAVGEGISIGAHDADGVYRRYVDICEPLEAPASEPTGYMRPCEDCSGSGTEERAGYIVPCMDCDGTGIHADEEDTQSMGVIVGDLVKKTEPAVLYVSFHTNVRFRLKVFENTVWIERQPNGENIPFDRSTVPSADLVYYPATNTWNLECIESLLAQYARVCAGIEV